MGLVYLACLPGRLLTLRLLKYIKTWIGELAPQSSYESDYLPRGGGW